MDEIARIETAAQAAGLTMTAVLARANVNPSTWWRWREGKTGPLVKSLAKVSEALDQELAAKAQ